MVAAVDQEGLPLTHSARAELVVELAISGKSVARLLSGDPVLDGSLQIEAQTLTAAGIPFEVAPGVSPITGIPAYAGFGLTGGNAREVHVVDAHDPDARLDMPADPRVTLVVQHGAELAQDVRPACWLRAGLHRRR